MARSKEEARAAGVLVRETQHAMKRGYRMILVRENGFPPLYKPAGDSLDACSDGRLLQVSPWAYHTARRRVSREQCLMLNRLRILSDMFPLE